MLSVLFKWARCNKKLQFSWKILLLGKAIQRLYRTLHVSQKILNLIRNIYSNELSVINLKPYTHDLGTGLAVQIPIKKLPNKKKMDLNEKQFFNFRSTQQMIKYKNFLQHFVKHAVYISPRRQ